MEGTLCSRKTDLARRSRRASCRLRGSWLCVLLVVLGGLANRGRADAADWKAGVAKAVITPEKAVWLAGYGTKRPPDGKLFRLSLIHI